MLGPGIFENFQGEYVRTEYSAKLTDGFCSERMCPTSPARLPRAIPEEITKIHQIGFTEAVGLSTECLSE